MECVNAALLTNVIQRVPINVIVELASVGLMPNVLQDLPVLEANVYALPIPNVQLQRPLRIHVTVPLKNACVIQLVHVLQRLLIYAQQLGVDVELLLQMWPLVVGLLQNV